MQYEFTQGTQDEKHEYAADSVDDEQAGASARQPTAGSKEEASSDRATDRDHLQLTRF